MKLQSSRHKSCVHHTTMHHVTSCKATYVRCTFGRMTGIFYVLLHQHGGETDTVIRVSTESRPWRRKFSRRSYRDLNPGPFSHESGALTTELSPSPSWTCVCVCVCVCVFWFVCLFIVLGVVLFFWFCCCCLFVVVVGLRVYYITHTRTHKVKQKNVFHGTVSRSVDHCPTRERQSYVTH